MPALARAEPEGPGKGRFEWSSSIVSVLLALSLSGCLSLPHVEEMQELISVAEPGSKIVKISYRSGMIFDSVAVRSILIGSESPTEKRWEKLGLHHSEDSAITWKLWSLNGSPPDIQEGWEDFRVHLDHVSKLIRERGLFSGPDMDIQLYLVSERISLDRTHRSVFRNSPSLAFYQFVDEGSLEEFEVSLIGALETVLHELVHLAAQRENLTFEGGSRRERELNEEIFAYASQACLRYALFRNFQGPDFRITVSLDSLESPKEPLNNAEFSF